jgi:ATP-dependent Clp protease ATP-binding subunit ClpA
MKNRNLMEMALSRSKKNKKVNLGGPGVNKTHGSVVETLKTRDKREKRQE